MTTSTPPKRSPPSSSTSATRTRAMDSGEFRAGQRRTDAAKVLHQFDCIFDVLDADRAAERGIGDAEMESMIEERRTRRKTRKTSNAPTRFAASCSNAA